VQKQYAFSDVDVDVDVVGGSRRAEARVRSLKRRALGCSRRGRTHAVLKRGFAR
jgi:hypothetical protein